MAADPQSASLAVESIFTHLPTVKPGTKFSIFQKRLPSPRLLLCGVSDVTCWDVDIDRTPVPVRSFAALAPLSNRDVLELYFSSLQVEKFGVLNSSSVKYYEVLAAWLVKYAAIVDRTPKATNAKLKKLEGEYVKLVQAYNRRTGNAQHVKLYDFLNKKFEWFEDHRINATMPVTTEGPSTTSDLRTAERPVTTSYVMTTAEPVNVRDSRSPVERLDVNTAEMVRSNQRLQRSLARTKGQNNRLEQQNDHLKSLVGVRVRDVKDLNNALASENERLETNVSKLKVKQKSMISRDEHTKVVSELQMECKTLKKAATLLTVQCDGVDSELVRLNKKCEMLEKDKDRLRKRASRKAVDISKLKETLANAKRNFETDAAAQELYHQGIVGHLQDEVSSGKEKQKEIEQQLDQLHQLETQTNNKYKPSVRLMYYDLLTKGVSANTVQSIVRSVLQHTTSYDIETVQLPSRTTAQRMVAEAGELVKVCAAYELALTSGSLGHHSDGTTKSLVHWGTHLLKLVVDQETKTFTLCVSPVGSGKSADTVEQLQKCLLELHGLSEQMGLAVEDNTYSISRIASRMSDRAPNEKAVTTLLEREKVNYLVQQPGWDNLSDVEKKEKSAIRDWTCAAHKVDNVATTVTDVSRKHMYPEATDKLIGAKKLVYEANKLLCQQSRKEYSKGLDFKLFALDDGSYSDSNLQFLKPIVGNRYLVFLMNSIPTLVSKDIVLTYLEYVKDSKEVVGLNKLETSVLLGYLDERVEAELVSFCLLYYYVLNPLLRKAKSANSPLFMNGFYNRTVMKLNYYADDSSELINGDCLLWPNATSGDCYESVMGRVLIYADKHRSTLTTLIPAVCAAAATKLTSHASEHLPGGKYFNPSANDVAAATLLGTATNDRVESCFGLLDRNQTSCPIRHPINTSALVTAKQDHIVAYVNDQDDALREKMVKTAMASAHSNRKEIGIRDKYLLDIWRKGKPARDAVIEKRRLGREKRQQRLDDTLTAVKEGELILDPTKISTLKGQAISRQLSMWNTLVKDGVAIANSDCLKGLSGLKVDAKRARLHTIVSQNVDIDLTRFRPTTESEGAGSESDEETEDVSVLAKGTDSTFVFDTVGPVVAVAFAGGAWYVGEIKRVVSQSTANVDYYHSTAPKFPLPEDCVWVKPKRRDLFRTDNTSVFMSGLVLEQVDTSSRQFKLTTSVADLNLAYLRFCHMHDIPQ